MTAWAGSVRRRTRPGGPDAGRRERLAASRNDGGDGVSAITGGRAAVLAGVVAVLGAGGAGAKSSGRFAWNANHAPDSSTRVPIPRIARARGGSGRRRLATLAAALEARASGSAGSPPGSPIGPR